MRDAKELITQVTHHIRDLQLQVTMGAMYGTLAPYPSCVSCTKVLVIVEAFNPLICQQNHPTWEFNLVICLMFDVFKIQIYSFKKTFHSKLMICVIKNLSLIIYYE